MNSLADSKATAVNEDSFKEVELRTSDEETEKVVSEFVKVDVNSTLMNDEEMLGFMARYEMSEKGTIGRMDTLLLRLKSKFVKRQKFSTLSSKESGEEEMSSNSSSNFHSLKLAALSPKSGTYKQTKSLEPERMSRSENSSSYEKEEDDDQISVIQPCPISEFFSTKCNNIQIFDYLKPDLWFYNMIKTFRSNRSAKCIVSASS
jgi:hypothetical protein